jgi:L-histidine N-alpha-methyltransferase
MPLSSTALVLDGNARDVLRGLTAHPKSLPARLFYDAAGSALFEQITELPEYYLTATEQAIFEQSACEMVGAAGGAATIVELGAGTARKTMLVLRAALDRHRTIRFIPIDVSGFALREARQRVRSELPQVRVQPLLLDYTERPFALARFAERKLVLFIGSSIGNFEPMAAGALLRRLRSALAPGDALLLGTDMRKPAEVLLPAYDDADGVTARFNLNILARLNREFDADFDLSLFTHRVRWNEHESRIEMHLESRAGQQVRIPALNLSLSIAAGETIHTENSYKFTPQMIDAIAVNGGFRIERAWSDERDWFRVSLLRA